jgi:hypothetical protein
MLRRDHLEFRVLCLAETALRALCQALAWAYRKVDKLYVDVTWRAMLVWQRIY